MAGAQPTQGSQSPQGQNLATPSPAYMPQGVVDLLRNPAIAAALAANTGQTDPRAQAQDIYERSPLKDEWRREAALLTPRGR